MTTIKICYWRFENGTTSPNGDHPIKEARLDPLPRGWYCWVYPQEDCDFIQWMENNCPTADHTFRFNSGDPMHTVYISDDKEAALFQLRWA